MGSRLLGIFTADGKLALLDRPEPVTQAFMEAVATGRPAEQRFRFTEPCIQGACTQWGNGRCGVADRAIARLPAMELPVEDCALRPECRWFLQSGWAACSVCLLVVTEKDAAPAVSLPIIRASTAP